MSNPYFRFRQFTVWHDRCAMKVGTDGVLLGAWTNVAGCRQMLDVGAGTGLVALMLAQRNGLAQVDGVELDAEAYEQAVKNVAASPFATRINLYHDAFDRFVQTTGRRYDLIVSNPPYFARSLKCPEKKRCLARHSDELSLDGLFDGSANLTTANGRLALILPFLQRDELMRVAQVHGWYCCRQTHVTPVPGATPKRLLAEFARRPVTLATDELTLEDEQHQRSVAYQTLTHEFYL